VFEDAKELGKFTHLEIDFVNDPAFGKEPRVVRAAIWDGGGT
jgi:hypothetical protein